ncbi:hypothetical protein [Balneatrix alpica]|uniref:Kazal-like domain-containing protein n=1 Tax=Balneatrix alpica TaxID=75684 RepID=A0ABV5ZCV0_9GAMM|nr:hypothetical protein [Balneatrix alpica]
MMLRTLFALILMLGMLPLSQANDKPCTGNQCQQQPHAMSQPQNCPECRERVLVVPKITTQCAKEVARVNYRAACSSCGNFSVTVRQDDRYMGPPCIKAGN